MQLIILSEWNWLCEREIMLLLKRNRIWIIFLLLSFYSSCGYRFAGGGSFPGGIKTVCITIFENRTSETGAESIFTNDLIYEVTRAGKAILTSKDRAEAILSGVIKSMNIRAISHEGTHVSLERRVTVTLDLKLTDPNGRVIWATKGISESEPYDVLQDKLETEQNKRDAISDLSERLAEKAYIRITENF